MDYTLSDAPQYVIKNIKLLQEIWWNRFDVIENNSKGDYSRHLLFILNDLREEIDNNKYRFSKNAYAKKFFKIQIANYCSFKKEQIDELDKIKRLWTKEVNQELCFITESLSDEDKTSKFELDDISILIQRIERKLIQENSFELIIEVLYDELIKENMNKKHIEFLVETVILLFNNKGILDLKFKLDEQLEEFQDIGSSESVVINDDEYQDNLYPMVFGSPSRNSQSINDYREELRVYYENLNIQQRLKLLKKIYCLEAQTYKVIFNIKGLKFTEKFNIGKVEFYNPERDYQYIKKELKKMNSFQNIVQL
ncbi:hypothetical protein FJR38_20560 [Anabaena sp. UHCC 0253]|uniref:hypothetical protein n=1 Tax=Anabaena sp. UHCC 0253 TaxID=2590019 RepID=UPI001445476D|nr:hypothetical protein [Anabaena sp. UHCC 0253]MTJ54884.1 hypothetical protein [Anabaena sp. UHCC 0253]